ncbi:MAG: hypothetical protein MUC69_02785 [Gemmatimonadales bacterium]|nr:hypothetical protein [Gemmatimonadales bacterium]
MTRAMRSVLLMALVVPAGAAPLRAQAPAAAQLAGAVASAPDSLRAGATVIGWTTTGGTAVLRKGGNHLVCVADEPGDARFATACYHESLEPFMARGRELKALRKTRAEIDSIRLADIAARRYPFPAQPTMLYNVAGSADSVGTDGVPRDAQRWYVLYTPYATPETTGLSLMPDGTGRPWLMYPGKPWAHAMITPK